MDQLICPGDKLYIIADDSSHKSGKANKSKTTGIKYKVVHFK